MSERDGPGLGPSHPYRSPCLQSGPPCSCVRPGASRSWVRSPPPLRPGRGARALASRAGNGSERSPPRGLGRPHGRRPARPAPKFENCQRLSNSAGRVRSQAPPTEGAGLSGTWSPAPGVPRRGVLSAPEPRPALRGQGVQQGPDPVSQTRRPRPRPARAASWGETGRRRDIPVSGGVTAVHGGWDPAGP